MWRALDAPAGKTGQALLFRPGDHLLGLSDKEVAGLSVLLPAPLFEEADAAEGAAGRQRCHTPQSFLDPRIPGDGALIQAARRLAQVAARRDPTAAIAAAELLDQLADTLPRLAAGGISGRGAGSVAARRRWELMAGASCWMEARLQEGFRVADLAAALGIPVRTLQWSFSQELREGVAVQAIPGDRIGLEDHRRTQLRTMHRVKKAGIGEHGRSGRPAIHDDPSRKARDGWLV